jgi:hypothetical protein
MTDNEVLAVRPGTKFTEFVNGYENDWTVAEVRYSGRCVNERSGAFGHAYCGVQCAFGNNGSRMGFSIESDEYIRGSGYATHDKNGLRIRGVELVA